MLTTSVPAMRKSINNVHIAWGYFAIEQGWKHKAELTWLLSRDATEACIKCGAPRDSGTALFCKCGRPYDPFAAFMAGEDVPVSYLSGLPDEQLKAVKAEMRRRKNLFADDEPTKK